MFGRVRHMIVKEFIQAFRNRKNWFPIFGAPVLQLFLFGYVVTTDVNNISTAIYDLDRTQESRELVRRLESSGYFSVNKYAQSPDEIRHLLDRGKVLCAIQINERFGEDLARKRPTGIQVIVDGSDSNTAMIAMNYATKIISDYSSEFAAPAAKAKLSTIDFRTRFWYNPDLKSRNYNVPGVIALVTMFVCLILTSMSVVREREMGTIEQIMVSPIRPIELMIGKTAPFALIALFDMVVVIIIGILWFGVTIKGSIIFLFIGALAYLLSILGIGLFISTVLKTQQQSLMATMFFAMPAILLSGFMFPIENMPEVFQYITYLNPLRYFLIIIRGVFLKGSGIDLLWPELLSLLALGVVIIFLSALRFRKRLG